MKKEKNSPKRVTGVKAPIVNVSDDKKCPESPLEKIARLEKELQDARLLADLYNEIINVAEKKFDIQIRKKAGTKQ